MFTNLCKTNLSRLTSSSNFGIQRFINTSKTLCKVEDKKMMLASLPSKDEGTIGEKSVDIDSLLNKYELP